MVFAMRLTFHVTSMAALVLAFGGLVTAAFAQQYPDRPIRLVVPYGPGGSTDILARIIGQKLVEKLGQQVVIDNRAGASGNVGAALVAKAPANGYTLLMGAASTQAINPSLYSRMPYDAIRDFAPISLVASVANVLVVLSSSPLDSLKNLVVVARSKPGELTYANGGTGDMTYLAGELFKSMAGLRIVHVAYKSGGDAVTAVFTKEVNFAFSGMPVAMPHITGNKLRALAISSPQRSSALPNVPTITESGYAGYEANGWFGVLAPAGTPKAIVDKLNSALVTILKTSDMHDRLAALGADPVGDTPEHFSSFIKAETAKWSKVIKDSGTPQVN